MTPLEKLRAFVDVNERADTFFLSKRDAASLLKSVETDRARLKHLKGMLIAIRERLDSMLPMVGVADLQPTSDNLHD